MKSLKYIFPFLLLFLLQFNNPIHSQESKVIQDMNLWTGVGLEKSFLQNWNLTVKQEIRFQKDITEINNFFSQAGLEYSITKNFALGGKYRYTRNHKSNGTYENKSRYSIELKYKGEIDFISIHYRVRYQKSVESFNLLKEFEPFEKYIRQRLSVRYNDIKRFKPYISGEIFQRYELYEYPKYDELRLIAGIKYKAGKIGVFDFAYGFEHELNNIMPYTIYLMKVNYTYKF